MVFPTISLNRASSRCEVSISQLPSFKLAELDPLHHSTVVTGLDSALQGPQSPSAFRAHTRTV